MKKLFFLFLICLPLKSVAQEIIVKSFEPESLMKLGNTGDWMKTNEGEDASKIVVKVQRSDISFSGRILRDEKTQKEIVECENGEYSFWMAPQSKSITVQIPGFNDKRVEVKDYIKEGLQPRRIYVMHLQVIPKTIVAGRNFSWGISGGYLMPMISTSADNFTGSPINYGIGNSNENASYSSPKGFVVGVNADIRLHKNIYLTVGVDYGQYTYTNALRGEADGIGLFGPNVKKNFGSAPVILNFKEAYNHSYVELPVLASYRFPIGRRSHVQVGAGPILNFGLSASCKINGEALFKDNTYYIDDTGCWYGYVYNGDFDLYSDKVDYMISDITETSSAKEFKLNSKFSSSPLNRFNVLAGLYLAYEFHGFQISAHYRYMITNFANDSYWDSQRFPVLNSESGNMPGYSLRHNNLQIRLGYTLRY